MNFFSIICVQLLLMLCSLQNVEGQSPLNKYIRHYEGLSYDTEGLRRQQSLVKDKMLQLHFHSYGRDFNLQFKRDTGQFSPDLIIQVSDELPMDIGEIDFIYTGQTFGENVTYTYTHGSVIDGRFEGYIKTHQGTYYVEPSERYFKERNVSYHSVIYHEDDVHYTYEGNCSEQSPFKKMQMYQEEAVHEPLPKYQALVNKPLGNEAPGPVTMQHEKATCELLIQTDHLFFEYYGTRQKVMDQIANHVKFLNTVYQRADFNGIRNINFVVKTIIINTTSAANDESNPFRFPDLSLAEFMILFTEQNHDNYCLAYAFTNRDFGKVLGAAWSSTVCHRQGWQKISMNTGVITVKTSNNHVPPKISHMTLAHEVGHNFGAPHDETPECIPGKKQGNYIMHPVNTGGDSPNNRKFSSCSIHYMSELLRERMPICFVKSDQPICGNGLVEKDEECDCGYSDQCKDSRCYNADEDDGKRCKLKPAKECNPTSTEGNPPKRHSITELLITIAEWIVTSWWAVLLIGIALTVLTAAFVTIVKKRQGMKMLFV